MKNQTFHLFLSFLVVCVAGQFLFAAESFRFVEDKDRKQLTVKEGKSPILTYQYDIIEHEHVPQSNPRRIAGCYVHPLYGLNGEILTDNAPADHFHHHGIFWTWSHVGIHEPNGKTVEYSLWESNSALKQHFVRWIGDKNVSAQSAMFEVENGWFIGDPKDGKKIMFEHVKIIVQRIQTVGDVRSRVIDFEFQWQPTDNPITLRGVEGKSYGGFSVRFKPFVPAKTTGAFAQRDENNRITVPSGIAEGDLPETPLAWADYTSDFFPVRNWLDPSEFIPEDRLSGAAIFVPKTHPDFPPTWLTRYYGPLCVGYPGVKGQTFQPGEKFELCYRIWIHEGAATVPQIEKAYEKYVR